MLSCMQKDVSKFITMFLTEFPTSRSSHTTAILIDYTFYAVQFKVGEVGQHECPQGYERIYFPNTCNLASQTLGLLYDEAENDYLEESICFLGGMSVPQSTRVSNQYEEYGKWVCQKQGFTTGIFNWRIYFVWRKYRIFYEWNLC